MFEAFCSYLQKVVVQNRWVLMLTDVNNYYRHLLHEFQGSTLKVTSAKQILEEKLKKCYGEKLCIDSGDNRTSYTLYNSSLLLEMCFKEIL